MSRSNPPELLIDATHAEKEYLKNLFQFRELLYFFAWRDILVRYKQAFFGVAWALFRPLLNMLVFAFLFGRLANFSSENVNYPLFVLAAMLPWQLFSNSVVDTCNSLINQSALISKVYFPRMMIPLSQILVHYLEFGITTVLLLILGMVFGQINYWTILTLPFMVLLLTILCVGIGLWLSALTVAYRDFRIIVPFFVQFGMFISPVGYGTFIISETWRWVYFLNPMAGIIDGFRWAFFGISYPMMEYSIIFSAIISCGILISGFHYFRTMERTFADQI